MLGKLKAKFLVRIGDLFQRRGNPEIAFWFYKLAAGHLPGDVLTEYAAAKALYAQGRFVDANTSAVSILSRVPAHVPSLNLVGAVALQNRDFVAAEAALQRALIFDPRYSPAWNNLGNIYLEQDRLADAERAYRAALASDRDYRESIVNLGTVLNRMARYDEAEVLCRRAIEIYPDYAGAYNNLANVLLNLNRLGEAERYYRKALDLQPDLSEAHVNLALALGEPAYLIGAIDHYKRQLELQPENYLANIRVGLGYFALQDFVAAEGHFQAAARLNPDAYEPLARLGDSRARLAFLDDALEYYDQALSVAAGHLDAVAGEIGTAHPDWGKGRCAAVAAVPMAGISSCRLFVRHYDGRADGPTLRQEAETWAELARGGGAEPRADSSLRRRDPDPERQLRVGYLSRDFASHSVAYFLEPLLAAHDRKAISTVAFCNLGQPDDMTARLRSLCAEWHDVHSLTDEELAILIRNERIDLLVDLSGHTGGNRLRALFDRPAPVQVTYLGYPGTTGMHEIDYRITDAVADPPASADADNTEQLVRLPGVFLCYQPPDWAPNVCELPAIERGFVTFGSFNNVLKVTPDVVAFWAKILLGVPKARVVLKGQPFASEAARDLYLGWFAAHGVTADRVDLLAWSPEGQGHLDLYNSIDIGLDPFPYNGTTTTCEALWMGVPVITLAGQRHSARVGTTLLTAIGLPELVAADTDSYCELAIGLAGDLPRLAHLRASLRERMNNSPLLDAPRLAREIENAYRQMWRDWCARQNATASFEAD